MVATIMAKKETEQPHCTYASVKIDDKILPIAKAASSLQGKSVQEWLSDLANQAASKFLGRDPIIRRPIKKRTR